VVCHNMFEREVVLTWTHVYSKRAGMVALVAQHACVIVWMIVHSSVQMYDAGTTSRAWLITRPREVKTQAKIFPRERFSIGFPDLHGQPRHMFIQLIYAAWNFWPQIFSCSVFSVTSNFVGKISLLSPRCSSSIATELYIEGFQDVVQQQRRNCHW